MSRPDPDRPLDSGADAADAVDIAVAVVERDGRFLVRRRPAGPLSGLWEFPGGKIEPPETPAEAAARECQEETGLHVEIVGDFGRHVERYSHGAVALHFLAAVDDRSRAAEASWQWVGRRRLAELTFPNGNRRLLRQLLDRHPPARL